MIVLGDARTNGREPQAEVFAQIAERAGRTFWLNPEPRLYWNYGDSVMAAYERHCTAAFECWTTRHLETFVNVVRRHRWSAPPPACRICRTYRYESDNRDFGGGAAADGG